MHPQRLMCFLLHPPFAPFPSSVGSSGADAPSQNSCQAGSGLLKVPVHLVKQEALLWHVSEGREMAVGGLSCPGAW